MGDGEGTRGEPAFDAVMVLRAAGFHRMSYARWGDGGGGDRPPVLCAHGLTRTGRDFDALSRDLAADRAVYCPDVLGRGRSDWLAAPEGYAYPFYMQDMSAVIARMGAPRIDWVGTSMGGIIGMLLAASANAPIRRLVLNDVGAEVPGDALQRIARYVSEDPHFDSIAAVEARLRRVHAPFGTLSDEHWAQLARVSSRPDPSGKGFRMHYDPKVGHALGDPDRIGAVDLWAVWDRLDLPVLVIRGVKSDLLLADTVAAMCRRGPGAKGLVETFDVADAGHAPTLADDATRGVIRAFLDR